MLQGIFIIKAWLRVAVITTMLAACTAEHPADPPEYWVWAGILPEEVPAGADILLYQGNFIVEGDTRLFDHKGVHPHPLERSGITLAFRLHELPAPELAVLVIETYITAWQRHGVSVSGVQLDFDSPSAKLDGYATFLAGVRERLPAGLDYSITGLGAWLAETDRETLAKLHDAVDYVAYQFYVGRTPLEQPGNYIRFLSRNPHPFKVGLLAHDRTINPGAFTGSPGFRGVIYFLQR